MSLYLKIILILLGLAYLISPVDIIPDLLLPYVGWIDDGVVLWTIYYLIRYGELPWFFFKKKSGMGNPGDKKKGWAPRTNQKKSDPGQASPNRTSPGRTSSRKSGKTKKKQPGQGNESPPLKSAHDILGISANATWKEIQTAYKEKIKRYHPDKVSHLGEEFSDLANEKFLEIQRAYEALEKKSH